MIKKFLREYLEKNPLDKDKKEKYCIVSHSRIIATLTALGVNPEDDSLIEYVWFKNCEMQVFDKFWSKKDGSLINNDVMTCYANEFNKLSLTASFWQNRKK